MSKAAKIAKVAADFKNLSVLRDYVAETLREDHVHADDIEDMVHAEDEFATNIIQHGYGGQPGEIELQILLEGDRLQVKLKDQARPFDPTQVPPPDLNLPLEKRTPGGLGIHLARHFVDAMIYRLPPEGGNELILLKTVRREDS